AAGEEPDVVAAELLADERGLVGHDLRGPIHEEARRLALLLARAQGVDLLVRPAREVLEDRLAQRLRRDRAGVDRPAADAVAALDHGDPLAQLRALDGRALPARAGADHQ